MKRLGVIETDAEQVSTDFMPTARRHNTVSSIRQMLENQSKARVAKSNEKTPAEQAFEEKLEDARKNEAKST